MIKLPFAWHIIILIVTSWFLSPLFYYSKYQSFFYAFSNWLGYCFVFGLLFEFASILLSPLVFSLFNIDISMPISRVQNKLGLLLGFFSTFIFILLSTPLANTFFNLSAHAFKF